MGIRAAIGLVIVSTACAAGDGVDAVDTCDAIDGAIFRSLTERECGRGPDGPLMCRWSVEFDDGDFTWLFSDIRLTGTYVCDGATILGSSFDADHTGTYTASTGRLLWQGVEYE